MAKKGKSNSAEKAAAKAAKKAKQEKSAQQKALKKEKKTQTAISQQNNAKGKGKGKGKSQSKAIKEDEEDLDALLAKFKADWELDHAVFEERQSGAPSRRANATLTPCPLGNDLWLFGGEYFDGETANFYADLYRYTPYTGPSSSKDLLDDPPSFITPPPPVTEERSKTELTETKSRDKGEWRSYSSRNQPGPRSAHQIVASPQNGGLLWLFGGEFASSRMTSFHHYRDLWVFSIATKSWDRIDTKVKPSARSGHRMAMWKNYLVLFGGFIDAGARTTYLNDLWVFSIEDYKWTEIKQNDLRRPSHRSGFSFIPTSDGIVLHGGYCKRYVKGQRTQGVALDDTWFLKMDENDLAKLDWIKRRKIGYIPNPPRSGCTMALWANKQMGILFGGVTDTEADEESLESTFWNGLYGYQLGGTGRWISLNLKKPKKMGGQGGKKKRERAVALAAARAAEAAKRREEAEARAKEEEEEARRGWSDDDDQHGSQSESESGSDSDSDADERDLRKNPAGGADTASSLATSGPPSFGVPDDPEDDEDDPQKSIPLERCNTMLAVQRNLLYLYGGIYESGNREYTLDDFYTLDLSKLDRFHCLKACPIDTLEWHDSEEEDSSSSSDSGSSSDNDDEAQGDEGLEDQEGVEYVEDVDEDLLDPNVGEDGLSLEERKQMAREKEELRAQATKFLGVSKDTSRTAEDVLSTPLPGESIAQFYERSKEYWSAKAFEAMNGQNRGKELRRDAFGLASKRYDEYKPLLKEIEQIQAEAGLDAQEMRNASKGSGSALNAGVGVDSRNRR